MRILYVAVAVCVWLVFLSKSCVSVNVNHTYWTAIDRINYIFTVCRIFLLSLFHLFFFSFPINFIQPKETEVLTYFFDVFFPPFFAISHPLFGTVLFTLQFIKSQARVDQENDRVKEHPKAIAWKRKYTHTHAAQVSVDKKTECQVKTIWSEQRVWACVSALFQWNVFIRNSLRIKLGILYVHSRSLTCIFSFYVI